MTELGTSPGEYGERVKNGPKPETAPQVVERPEHSTESKREVGRVALESIRLPEAVPSIDWESAKALARPVHEYRIGGLARKYGEFLPAVASAVAHKRDPSIERIKPTVEQIRRDGTDAGFFYKILRFFGLAGWFDRMLAREADKRIDRYADLIDSNLKRVAKIEKPKEQFLDELHDLYTRVTSGDEKSLRHNRLYNAVSRLFWSPEDRDKYPLLGGILADVSRNPLLGRSKVGLRAVTPEVIKGVGTFLESQGRERDEASEDVGKSVSRRAAERIAGAKGIRKFVKLDAAAAKITDRVAEALEHTYSALPEKGQDFADDVYDLCAKITKLAASGYSGEEITNQLVGSFFGKKPRG